MKPIALIHGAGQCGTYLNVSDLKESLKVGDKISPFGVMKRTFKGCKQCGQGDVFDEPMKFCVTKDVEAAEFTVISIYPPLIPYFPRETEGHRHEFDFATVDYSPPNGQILSLEIA